MNPNLFLIAKVDPSDLFGDLSWVLSENVPYQQIDYLDFESSEEINVIYELYSEAYKFEKNEPLNIPNKEQLVEYNRWIILIDNDNIVGFVAMKTTAYGLKLCLTATDKSEASRTAIKTFFVNVLNIEGCYCEVSRALEKIVVNHVPEIAASEVEDILGKEIKEDADNRHYRRIISRVGMRKKLLVGRPYLSE